MGEPMFVPLGVMSMIGICDNLGRKEGNLLGHPATVPSVVPMGIPILVPLDVMSMIGDVVDVVDVIELCYDNLRKKGKTYWEVSQQNQLYQGIMLSEGGY